MMRRVAGTWGFVSIVTVFLVVGTSSAQDLPWESFEDELTGDICEVVNAAPNRLVVLLDGTLTIVSGPDRVLDDSFVDANLDVFFDGLDESLGGSIIFDFDGLGNRSLWWVWPTGHVMGIDDFSGEILISEFFPSDFLDALCDACPLWDDPSVCEFDEPDPPIVLPPVTIEICGSGIPVSIGMILSSLMFLRFSRRRTC